jgi:hypothetical protein
LQDWLALSDREALSGADPAPVARGLFVLEFRLPLDGPTVLLRHQTEDGRSLSVFHDPDAGPSILLRDGARLCRHSLACRLAPDLSGVARLGLWQGGGTWRLTYQVLGQSAVMQAQGAAPLPFDGALIRQVCDRMSGAHRHPAVLWFGLTLANDLPKSAPWIGPNTPIETAHGPVPAGQLQPGTGIRTLDHGILPLKALHRMSLPAAGSFAPVVLRRPFFAMDRDLLVSADQHLLISGASVEYLTGEEEVLVPAGALADGRVAERDNRRAVTHSVALDLGRPALVLADGCMLLSQPPGAESPPPRRVLQDWELAPLLSLLGRTSLRPAA